MVELFILAVVSAYLTRVAQYLSAKEEASRR